MPHTRRLPLALLLAALACAPTPPEHVLLISVDSLRADRLGAYGYDRGTSPHLDALAREGVLFERASSSTSWTLPAHAALFTGLDDRRHGVQAEELALADEIPTLAERLAAQGFATAAIVSGPYLHPAHGLDRGFDAYLNCMSYLDDVFAPRRGGDVDLNPESHRDTTGPCAVRRARDWMAGHRDEPWFLFVHLWDAHYDYRPPPRLAERFRREGARAFDASDFARNPRIHPRMPPERLAWVEGLYDAEVAHVDEQLGELLTALDEFSDPARALVVFTADHGDAFFEHGRKGHQQDLHAEVVGIPLVLRGPGVPRGSRLPGPAHITDVAPTLLELVGAPPLGGVDGRSLVGAWRDPGSFEGRWLLSELRLRGRHELALESLDRKLIRDERSGDVLAYDLKTDPAERRPLRPDADDLARLDARIEQLERRAARTPPPRLRADADPELVERLRALGYAD